MRDRWTAWWRRRVPEPTRSRVFDPALEDLRREWTGRARGALRRRASVARLALSARLLARRRGGDPPARRSAGEALMAGLHDLRVAARRLARQPAFAATAILTLALGIGANLSVAAFVQALLLAPVDAAEPGRLVRVIRTSPNGATTDIASWPVYVQARDDLAGLDLAAHATASALVGRGERAELRATELVSGNYFRVLGHAPLAGRLLDDRDNAPSSPPVVVVSEAYWRARLGADPGAVGRTLEINSTPFEIVGVAPPGFRGTWHAHAMDLWAPIVTQEYVRPRGLSIDNPNWGWLRLIARRAPGVSPQAAQAELDAAAASLNERMPPREPGQALAFLATEASAVAASDREVVAPVLATTLAFTGLLFVVACANLGGLMQAQLLGRRRELAIRLSLGATRGRALSAWGIECGLIAAAGGLVGLLAARGAVAALGAVRPPSQLVGDLSLVASFDARLALYAAALSAVAMLVCGVLPAWLTRRRAPAAWLRDEPGTAAGSRGAARWRRAAVVLQLALSGVLLLAAALLARSLVNHQRFDPGFETAHLGLLHFDLRRHRVPESDWRRLVEASLERVRRDPDVRAADIGLSVPLGFGSDVLGVVIAGHTPASGRPYELVDFNTVGSGYFEALGVPFVRGGPWPAAPPAGALPEVVINETMARRFFAGRDPVGAIVEFAGATPVPARVSGVVRDVAYYEIGGDPLPYLYRPAAFALPAEFLLLVRTAGAPAPVLRRLAEAIEGVDRRLVALDVMTFDELRRIPLFPARVLAASALVFGSLAVLIAGVGLYGVVTMSVSRRTREIGVRMALGARPAAVLGAVLRESVWLGLVGVALALAGGYAAAGALRSWLFGVSRFDGVASLLVGAVLLSLAVLSAWLPARRASRVDPVIALRE